MDIIDVSKISERKAEDLLKKPAFDEVELSPKIREANRKLYGKDMTAKEIVDMIVDDVRNDGDKAVQKYTKLIDRTDLNPYEFLVTDSEYEDAKKNADSAVVKALEKAAENVRRYHEEQKPESWMSYRSHGSILGQSLVPLDKVGIYVPGGTAAYPSSVLMNAIPASVAGVGEIVMMCPLERWSLRDGFTLDISLFYTFVYFYSLCQCVFHNGLLQLNYI